jgi:alkylation response protein AidB-like acyl-CoA dehydrogenase
MAGYSGTPLPRKLGIKENFRIALVEIPTAVRAELKEALAECKVAKDGPLDFAMLFVKTQAELKQKFSKIAKQLAPAGMLWVSWPKKASGVATDLNENDVRKIGLDAGLVDVKICAVNEVWSGLKFVIPVAQRGKR